MVWGCQVTPRHEVLERSNADLANAWSDPNNVLQQNALPQVQPHCLHLWLVGSNWM